MAAVAALLLAATAGPASGHDPTAAPRPAPPPSVSATPWLPVIHHAPDFTLLGTGGRPVRLTGLRGRVVLMNFIYTSCTTTCPLVTAQIVRLRGRLSQSPGVASGVRFLSVTVDPERDSAAVLRRYALRFGASGSDWEFLREEPERLTPVLSAYGEWTRREASGDIDHPARLYLIDQRGEIREIYSLAFFDDRQALVDIQALLTERR